MYFNTVCVSAGYGNAHRGYPAYQPHSPYGYTTNSTSYTGGLTEEEQIEAAIRNSLNDGGEGGRRDKSFMRDA